MVTYIFLSVWWSGCVMPYENKMSSSSVSCLLCKESVKIRHSLERWNSRKSQAFIYKKGKKKSKNILFVDCISYFYSVADELQRENVSVLLCRQQVNTQPTLQHTYVRSELHKQHLFKHFRTCSLLMQREWTRRGKQSVTLKWNVVWFIVPRCTFYFLD